MVYLNDKFEIVKKKIEELTKKSVAEEDYVHSQLTWKNVLKLKTNADIALQVAALGHDIDRSFPERRVKKEDFKDYNEYKKQHSFVSAKIISELMSECHFEEKIIDKTRYLIENHEIGGGEEINVLMNADSLAFFEYNIPFYLKRNGEEKAKQKIQFMYNRLSPTAKELNSQIKFSDEQIRTLVRQSLIEIF
ncbi:MAG: HD domain-containing protein [Patescibacteria group bacterium]|jgi:hypothetical protein